MSRYNAIVRWTVIIIGSTFIVVAACQAISRAQNKWFWWDEAYEVLISCAVPYSTLIVDGPPAQCSSAPLYYLIQRAVITHTPLRDGNILVAYRGISIVFFFLSLTILTWSIHKFIGPIYAFLAFFLMNNQAILRVYSAENRPYLLWTFLFTSCLLLFSSLATKKYVGSDRFHKVILLGATTALGTVSTASVVQIPMFCLFALVFVNGFTVSAYKKDKLVRYLLLVLLVSMSPALFYALHKCPALEEFMLRKQQLEMNRVVSLLFPMSLTVPVYLFNSLFIIGVVSSFLLFRKRHTLGMRDKMAVSLSTCCNFQIMAAVIIGILVAKEHYLFIPRLFIFLTVIRACLVSVGAYFLFSWIKSTFLKDQSIYHERLVELTLLMFVVIGVVLLLMRNQGLQEERFSNAPQLQTLNFTCQKSQRIVIARKSSDDITQWLNFVTLLSQKVNFCPGPFVEKKAAYYFPDFSGRNPSYRIEMRDQPPDPRIYQLVTLGHPLLDAQ